MFTVIDGRQPKAGEAETVTHVSLAIYLNKVPRACLSVTMFDWGCDITFS